VIQDKVKER